MTDYIRTNDGLIVPASYGEAAATADMREIATTADGRDITRGYVTPMQVLQPQDTILQARGGGNYNLYREVLRDWQVKSTLAQRQLAVTSKAWEVEPGGKRAKDKAAADFIREQLASINWDNITEKMLYGVFYGHAVAEILWQPDGSFVGIKEIKVRDRRRFVYDGAMQLRLVTTANMTPGELVPERKFWNFCVGADHDDEPYGLGLAHWLYWPVFFKRNDIKFWLIFLEKFGQPTAVGKYPSTATPEEKSRLLAALGAVATESGIIVPEGMLVELLEAARSGTGDYTAMHDRMDQAIAKVVLGQTLTSEAIGGQYKADVQMDVRQDLVKADADLVCASFNRGAVAWLTEWNFPGAAAPRVWRQIDEGDDLEKRAAVDKTLHDMGYRPRDVSYINETYGGEWVEMAPTAAPAPGGDQAAPAQFAEPGQPQPVADAVAETVDDQEAMDAAAVEFAARYQAFVGAQIDELIAYAEHTGDLATLRSRITELLAAAPNADAVQALERGAFGARLLAQVTGTAR